MSEKMKVSKRVYTSMRIDAEKAEKKAAEARRIADMKRRNFEAVEWEGAAKAAARAAAKGES